MVKKNILSITVALVIMYLSLTSSHTFDKVPLFKIHFIDKIVHFGMYFGLMSILILENRKRLKNTKNLFLISLIPFVYGILMEVLQALITVTRTGSVYDAMSNTAGIVCSVLLWLWIEPMIKEKIR